MNAMSSHLTATLIGDDTLMTLAELARACRAAEEQVHVWVVEGVLQPSGNSPVEWRFTGASLRRAKLAVTLTRELEINAPGIALALDLMDEIEALKASLRRRGIA
jgi:chaperone modulatory protein CbpM